MSRTIFKYRIPKAPLKHIAYWALLALRKEHSRG